MVSYTWRTKDGKVLFVDEIVIKKEEIMKIECPEHFGVYEMAKYFEELYQGLRFPLRPERPNRQDFNSHASHSLAIEEYEDEIIPRYKIALRNYELEKSKIMLAFKENLLKKLGLEKHPKADLFYSMAYERGHSSGFLGIATIASGLADLIRD